MVSFALSRIMIDIASLQTPLSLAPISLGPFRTANAKERRRSESLASRTINATTVGIHSKLARTM
jgi:hypothetical protein